MKRLLYLILLLVTFVNVGCDNYEPESTTLDCDVWNTNLTLASAQNVVYNDTLYLFFGRTENNSSRQPSEKIYYAPMNDLSDFSFCDLPIKPRVSASSILLGDKLYMGLGFNGRVYNDTANLCDWYCYDFVTDKLHILADFPDKCTVQPVIWNSGDYIYAAMGFSTFFERKVYRYSIHSNEWTLVSDDSPMWVRAGLVGQKLGCNVYMGTGYRTEMMNDWWSYDYVNNIWDRCKNMPTKGRVFSSSVLIGEYIYVLGGRFFGGTETREYFYEDVIAYNTNNDEWSVIGNMPQGGTENMISFQYNGNLYWGLGQMEGGKFSNKIFKYTIR